MHPAQPWVDVSRKGRQAMVEGRACGGTADRPGRAHGGKLTAAARDALPKGEFALPGHGDGARGKGTGSYPIPDRGHARAALAEAAAHASLSERATIKRKVQAKFPDIKQG